MIARVPTSTCINGDTIAEDVHDENGKVVFKRDTVIDNNINVALLELGIECLSIYNPIKNIEDVDKLHKEIIQDVRNSLSEVLFRKEYLYTRITKYLAHMYESIHNNQIIIKALDRIKKSDEYTFTHSINTAFYSMFIAIWMNLSDKEIINATQAGILHDIGKIYIPKEILNKKGRFTTEEYEQVKKHTLYGYSLLSEFGEFDEDVKRAVLFHHERIDGKGYPLSASSDRVGLIAKIVAIADVYDAMTTDRVYKKAASPYEVINYFSGDGMKLFDNDVLKVFLENIPLYDFKVKI